ncbi:hypothetical protein N2152v2_008790 [Parachlorella kessleri]
MASQEPLPKLPGYQISPPLSLAGAAFHKKQTLVWKNGYALPVETAPAAPSSTLTPAQASNDWQQLLPHHLTTYTAVTANVAVMNRSNPAKDPPKWLEYDKKVLRFFGFFQEVVPDSREETWRVRKVVILLYLEDDSLQVVEPPETNSGLPQGTFIRRHKIPRSGGAGSGFLGLTDLLVGSAVTIYGRTIYICDADPFTRSFATARGISLAEALLGKEAMNRQLKQFLENSKQDNTAEILEMLEANSGKDPFPAFLKRGTLPKAVVAGAPGSRPPANLNYKPQDLRIGSTIQVYGRDFFLYDCDDFTRTWSQEQMGMTDAELAPIDVSEPRKPLPKPSLPPHNGYGSLEDSLQNCVKLVPTAPKRDLLALMNKDRIVLRFLCRLLDGSGYRLNNIDRERRFVLSYFCADDTLSVFEPPVPNSGIMGGKYLERMKAPKPQAAAGTYYKEQDLFAGARITLQTKVFELLEADKFTQDFKNRA